MKKRIKLIAYILSCVMGFAGSKMMVEEITRKNKIDSQNNQTTSQTTPVDETPKETASSITEFIEDIFKNQNETEPTIYNETETLAPIVMDDVLVASSDTDIRANCSKDALVVGKLEINDTAIRILSSGNNWELVKTNDQIGYVLTSCLKSTNETVERHVEHTLKNDFVLTTTDLNFRTGPSTEHDVIKTFKINTELRVVAETDNGWLLVQHNDKLGYISKEYTTSLLEKAQSQYPELELTELNVEKIVYIDATGLFVRQGAGTEFDALGQLANLESTRVLGEYGDWYFVMENDYNFGFINKNYTEELEGIYVIVDLSEQKVYMYNNNQLYCIADVTTGKDSTPSDIGLFKIWYKGMNEEITPGYVVDFWMPYNRGEGLHDAERWRQVYGMHTEEEKQAQSYRWNGSNGCINMERVNAKLIYENTSIGTPVLVHK